MNNKYNNVNDAMSLEGSNESMSLESFSDDLFDNITLEELDTFDYSDFNLSPFYSPTPKPQEEFTFEKVIRRPNEKKIKSKKFIEYKPKNGVEIAKPRCLSNLSESNSKPSSHQALSCLMYVSDLTWISIAYDTFRINDIEMQTLKKYLLDNNNFNLKLQMLLRKRLTYIKFNTGPCKSVLKPTRDLFVSIALSDHIKYSPRNRAYVLQDVFECIEQKIIDQTKHSKIVRRIWFCNGKDFPPLEGERFVETFELSNSFVNQHFLTFKRHTKMMFINNDDVQEFILFRRFECIKVKELH